MKVHKYFICISQFNLMKLVEKYKKWVDDHCNPIEEGSLFLDLNKLINTYSNVLQGVHVDYGTVIAQNISVGPIVN